MDGIVYFGSNTFNLNPWINQLNISHAIDALKNIVSVINKSKFAKVKVPSDWSEFREDGANFWDRLEEIIQGQSELLGYIASSIFDGAFNQCVDEGVTIAQAEDAILTNNPNTTSMKYFSALKVDGEWPKIPANLHVETEEDLFEFGLNFLKNSPYSERSYAERCVGVFTNLVFHHEFSSSLSGHGKTSKFSKYGKAPITGINGFSNSVTRSLAAANSVDLNDKDTKRVLYEIQATCGFPCSPEGSRNSHLFFDFFLSHF